MEAYRADFTDLRNEIRLAAQQSAARFAQIDGRFDRLEQRMDDKLEAQHSKAVALIERGLREQTQFFFLAWSVLLVFVVGLYTR